MIRSLTVSLLSCFFGFLALVASPFPALAKTPTSFAVNSASSTVMVAAVYETGYSTQKTVVKGLKAEKATLKKALGFGGMSVLQSEDGLRVVVLSQWQDTASFENYRTSIPSAASTTLKPPSPARVTLFKVIKTQTYRTGANPTLRGKEAIVEFSEFSMSDPANTPDIQTDLETMMDQVFQQQPPPQAVVMLQSADPQEFALLANWNCTADFEETGKPLGFESNPSALPSLAQSDQRFYSVVRILPANVPKQSKSDATVDPSAPMPA